MRKAKSYLLGYFYGDGSARIIRGRYRQYRFFCTNDDKPRVNRKARELGVNLKWRQHAKGVEVATWPLKQAHLLDLEGLEKFNSYDRRLRKPPWFDPISFLEGIWDADGSVGKNERGITFVHLGLTNHGLIEDIKTLLEDLGMEPTTDNQKHRQVRLRKTGIQKFANLLRLQPKKDAYLAEIRT